VDRRLESTGYKDESYYSHLLDIGKKSVAAILEPQAAIKI